MDWRDLLYAYFQDAVGKICTAAIIMFVIYIVYKFVDAKNERERRIIIAKAEIVKEAMTPKVVKKVT